MCEECKDVLECVSNLEVKGFYRVEGNNLFFVSIMETRKCVYDL